MLPAVAYLGRAAIGPEAPLDPACVDEPDQQGAMRTSPEWRCPWLHALSPTAEASSGSTPAVHDRRAHTDFAAVRVIVGEKCRTHRHRRSRLALNPIRFRPDGHHVTPTATGSQPHHGQPTGPSMVVLTILVGV